jgi:hypothetical protein
MCFEKSVHTDKTPAAIGTETFVTCQVDASEHKCPEEIVEHLRKELLEVYRHQGMASSSDRRCVIVSVRDNGVGIGRGATFSLRLSIAARRTPRENLGNGNGTTNNRIGS